MKMYDKEAGLLELEEFMGGDDAVVRAARICYGRDDIRGKGKLIRHLIQNGHTSVFEHAVFRFKVICPIFTQRQLMRHRISSYTERSSRYTNSDSFYYPSTQRMDPDLLSHFSIAYNTAYVQYNNLLSKGAPRELARSVLPMGTMTEFKWTINVRSLMNFLELRLDEHAQYEIRQIARQAENYFADKMPITYREWKRRYDYERS